jgi:hypothetical protein
MGAVIKVPGGQTDQPNLEVKGRCPGCGRDVAFQALEVPDLNAGAYRLGQRKCPRAECSSHIFFVWRGGSLITTYPALRVPFEKANVPDGVVQTSQEAITCHAEDCQKAAAIMIRRTLEEICRDRAAVGKTLRDRIKALENLVVIPKELFQCMDELRVLGNDAAHVESREYDEIGKDEVEVGIELTKEILKAVYQYSHLLTRMRALKKKEESGGTEAQPPTG